MSCLNPQTRKSASNFTQISQFDAHFKDCVKLAVFLSIFEIFLHFMESLVKLPI